MYRKFYSYNDMPVIKPSAPIPKPHKELKPQPKKENQQNGLFSGLENDDIILLVVFLILVLDNCEDRLLLLALGFIFFSDYFT